MQADIQKKERWGIHFWSVVFIFFLSPLFSQSQVSAKFTADVISGCAPLQVNFTDQSTGNITNWSWDLGVSTSSAKNPTAIYLAGGTYTVKLTVSNTAGATSTSTTIITVYALPAVDFSSSDTIGCTPLVTQFTDLSNSGSGTLTQWEWNFGDGATSTQQYPTHSYTTAGTYGIVLKVTNSHGCVKTGSKAQYIKAGSSVKAGFSSAVPSYCNFPVSIPFTNTTAATGNTFYAWQFGDGQISSQLNPTHTYSSPSNYNVTLIASNNEGCADTVSKPINLTARQSSFTGPNVLCAGVAGNFITTSSPAPVSVVWNMGDGTTYTTTTVNHTYATGGSYVVKMINDFGGCKDSISKTITVNSFTQVNFSAPVTSNCKAPLTVNFQDQSAGANSWAWDFGDGTKSSNPNPTHTYTDTAKFTVTLVAGNSNGCFGTSQKTSFINIIPPSITVTNAPVYGCPPYTYSPKYNVGGVDNIASYSWDFGDGFISTSANPSHTYTSIGSYTIVVKFTSVNGCSDSLRLAYAVSLGEPTTVDFSTSPTPVCNGKVTFTPMVGLTPDSYAWNFGDGTVSTSKNPTHSYTDTVPYSVSLVVNKGGCNSSATKTNVVKVAGPIAKFSFTKDCINRGRVSFTNASLNGTSVKWDFGDGNTSAANNPVYTYNADSNYKVMLVIGNGACTDTVIQTVPVWLGKTAFTSTANTLCKGGRNILFLNHPNPSQVVSYNWNFTGNPNDPFINTPSSPVGWVYNKTGNYGFIGYTIDAFGCRDSVGIPQVIRVNGPAANFGVINNNGCVASVSNFSDSSASDGVNAIKQWSWDFGDNTSQNFTNAPFTHKYNAAGSYTVKLKVTDASGCSDSLTRSSLITINQGKAGFTSVDSFACPGSNVRFTDQSSGNIMSYKWSFGDGSTSTIASPIHIYATTGVYPVQLIIAASSGCSDTLIKNNFVTVKKPIAKFSVSDSVSNCPPTQINFFDSSVYVQTWKWSFGDGNTAAGQKATNIFITPGNYKAQLIAASPGGCMDSAFKNIVVYGPTGKLTYSPLSGCSPLQVSFKATNVFGASNYIWDYGDGIASTTTDSSSIHSYLTLGDYLPKVLLKDAKGCVVPYSGVDTIFVEKIRPAFGSNVRTLCDSGSVTFTDSTVANGSLNRIWYFGDGRTSTLKNPVHKYIAPGLYNVKLVIQSSFGCSDSISYGAYIKVVKSPSIAIVAPDSICEGPVNFSVQLAPDTSKIVSWAWTFENGNRSSLQTPVTQNFTTGPYKNTLIATNTSGCITTVQRRLTVLSLPVLQLTNDTTICEGSSIQLKASGANTYTWTATAPATLSCSTCDNPVVSSITNTMFKVKGISTSGCFSLDSVKLKVLPKYILSVSPDVNVCTNASVQLTASGAPNYMWSPSSGLSAVNIANPKASPVTTTTYTVIGYDSLGCFTDTAFVTTRVFTYPKVDLGPDITVSIGNTLTLNSVVTNDVVSYRWTPTTDLSCATCPSPSLTSRQDILYRLLVTNNGGCVAEDSIRIIVTCNNSSVFVPNTFSPNGDGMNDIFYPRGKGIFSIRDLKIFNRWGEPVFEKRDFPPNDPSSGWTGMYKGKMAEVGVYTYYVEIVCNSSQVLKYFGNINLIQ